MSNFPRFLHLLEQIVVDSSSEEFFFFEWGVSFVLGFWILKVIDFGCYMDTFDTEVYVD